MSELLSKVYFPCLRLRLLLVGLVVVLVYFFLASLRRRCNGYLFGLCDEARRRDPREMCWKRSEGLI